MTQVWLIHEDLVGRFKSEAFSGAVIEKVHGEGDLVRGNGIKAHLLREALANQSVSKNRY